MNKHKTRVVVVSGGTRGLGLEIIKRFVEDGDIVVTFGRKITSELQSLIEQYGPDQVKFTPLDLADLSGVRKFISHVRKDFGRIDVLINNAALANVGLLLTLNDHDIRSMLDVNVLGTLNITRACARVMSLQRSGVIINISSIVGKNGFRGLSVYGATKAALDAITRSLARELGPLGIRVNSVAPGFILTDMSASLSEEQRRQIIRRTPLGRLATVEDIVPVIRFLVSDEARFITGQVFVIDGGATC